jgi:hypothetical protein
VGATVAHYCLLLAATYACTGHEFQLFKDSYTLRAMSISQGVCFRNIVIDDGRARVAMTPALRMANCI